MASSETGRVKITDIARHTGFSIGTISKALQNRPGIAQETRNKIIAAAQKIGYIPNAQAGALRSGATRTVAIIISDIANPMFSIQIESCVNALKQYNYRAIVMDTGESETLEEQAVISAFSRNVDGVLLCPTQKSKHPIELLRKNGMPYVLMGRSFEDGQSDSVVCDDELGGYLAGKELLDTGHRHILAVTAGNLISSSVHRLSGFQRAMRECNEPVFSHILEAEAVAQGIGSLTLRYLQAHSEITALFAFSDLLAWDIIYTLGEHCIRVPEDISIVGFDDIQSHMRFPPPLTTIHYPKTRLCNTCVDLLMQRIRDPHKPFEQRILDVYPVRRSSSRNIDI